MNILNMHTVNYNYIYIQHNIVILILFLMNQQLDRDLNWFLQPNW